MLPLGVVKIYKDKEEVTLLRKVLLPIAGSQGTSYRITFATSDGGRWDAVWRFHCMNGFNWEAHLDTDIIPKSVIVEVCDG